MYAIESALPDKPENQLMEKVFIRQDDLFDVLSKNPKGLHYIIITIIIIIMITATKTP